MLTTSGIIAITVIVFLASMVQGLSGMGFALLTTPLVLSLLPAVVAVPFLLILSACILFLVLLDSYKHMQWKLVAPMTIAGLLGVPLGFQILQSVDTTYLKLAIGIMVSAFAVVQYVGFKLPIKNELIASPVVGFLTGVLKGSTSISGPPIALFLENQSVEKQVFRANMVGFSLVLSSTVVGLALYNDVDFSAVKSHLPMWIVVVIIGAFFGIVLSRHVPQQRFRQFTLILVFCAGIAAIVKALGAL